jgi:hypothetical protein
MFLKFHFPKLFPKNSPKNFAENFAENPGKKFENFPKIIYNIYVKRREKKRKT